MQKRRSKTYRHLLALAVLGGAAVFAIYYLYYRTPATSGSKEIVARPTAADPSATINSKITYQFTEEERQAALSRPDVTPSSEPANPEPISSVPGIKYIPADTEKQPSNGPSAMIPSALDSPPPTPGSAENDTNEAPAPSLTAPSQTASNNIQPPAPIAQPLPEPVNRTMSDEKIPHLDEVGTGQPIPTVLTPLDHQTDKPVNLDSKDAQNQAPPPSTPQPNPLEKTNDFKPKSSHPRKISDKVWVINALSTQDEKRQWLVFKALSQYPYRVYTYSTLVKGKEWKRIRVGFFTTREEAATVGEKLRQKHRLPEPWIVRPGPEEMEKFYLK